MNNPIKISLSVKDFNLPILRIDAWVTEAIKESKIATQVLNKNDFTRIIESIKKNQENLQKSTEFTKLIH